MIFTLFSAFAAKSDVNPSVRPALFRNLDAMTPPLIAGIAGLGT